MKLSSRLWLYWLPLLYLPNLGLANDTAYGMLRISDFLIFPYIVLVLIGIKSDPEYRKYRKLIPWLVGFVVAAFVSTITIQLRYTGASNYVVIFGLLKIGKLVLYAVVGLLTARALALPQSRERYDWAILVSTIIVSFSLWFTSDDVQSSSQTIQGYNATNLTSVMTAILLVYLGGRYLVNANSPRWRKWFIMLMPILVLGFLLSRGRGGWAAALVGITYLAYKYGLNKKIWFAIVLVLISITFAYQQYPSFKKEVDKTFWPEQQYLEKYNIGIGGIDEGGRLFIWSNSIMQVQNAPVLGTGIFHRGGLSGIYSSGSHNFFLQILLETGIIGFLFLLGLLVTVIKQIHNIQHSHSKLYLPVMGAMVTALIGGLSGEYFYGGMGLLTLFIVYAPVGSLPTNNS